MLLIGALTPACFAESLPLDPTPMDADSGGTDDDDDGDQADDGDTSGGDGDSAGDDDRQDTDSDGGSDSDGEQDDEGGPQPTVVFDYYERACDGSTERQGANPVSTEIALIECGPVRGVGGVDQHESQALAAGTPGERVVVFTMAPFSESLMSLDTIDPLPLAGAAGPVFRARIGCPDGSTGTFQWQINYTGDAIISAAEGTHTCGDPPEVVEAALLNDEDRTLGIVVFSQSEGPLQVAIVDPVVIELPA